MNSEEPSSKPDLYVIARLIKALKEEGRMNRTTLATSTGLAYDRMKMYLDWMIGKGFVIVGEDGLVAISQRGIETYDELVKWIMRYVGKLKFPRLGG